VGDEEGDCFALLSCRVKISKYNVHGSALIFHIGMIHTISSIKSYIL
jgi:hypothetical protein